MSAVRQAADSLPSELLAAACAAWNHKPTKPETLDEYLGRHASAMKLARECFMLLRLEKAAGGK